MHVGAILEIADYPNGKVGFERLASIVASRIDQLGWLKEMVVESAIPLVAPRWVDDEQFDLRDHLGWEKIPTDDSSLSNPAVSEVVNRLLATPLPRNRPPWSITYIETNGSRDLVVARVHHASLDGSLGITSLATLLDFAPVEVRPLKLASRRADETSKASDLVPPKVGLLESLGSLPGELLGRMRSATALVESLSGLMEATGITDPAALNDLLNLGAPRYSTTGMLTTERSYANWGISLARISRVARAARMTINDVVLAVTGAAYRSYHLSIGDPRAEVRPVALVPISTRSGERAHLRNAVSAQLVELPIGAASPRDQLDATHRATLAAKDLHGLLGPNAVAALAGMAPGRLAVPLVRFVETSQLFLRVDPPFNLVVSNLTGSPVELFLGGSAVESIVPFGPIAHGAPLNLTMASYIDTLWVGLTYAPDLFHDAELFIAAFESILSGFEESMR
jgi:WS/DGAT/MGAT family acyltransferase